MRLLCVCYWPCLFLCARRGCLNVMTRMFKINPRFESLTTFVTRPISDAYTRTSSSLQLPRKTCLGTALRLP